MIEPHDAVPVACSQVEHVRHTRPAALGGFLAVVLPHVMDTTTVLVENTAIDGKESGHRRRTANQPAR